MFINPHCILGGDTVLTFYTYYQMLVHVTPKRKNQPREHCIFGNRPNYYLFQRKYNLYFEKVCVICCQKCLLDINHMEKYNTVTLQIKLLVLETLC